MNLQNSVRISVEIFFYIKKDQPALDLLRGLTLALRTLISSRQPVYLF